MSYDAELEFFKNLLQNLDLPFRIFPDFAEEDFKKELYIYYLFNPNFSYPATYEKMHQFCKPNCIYRAYDELHCNYLFFQLPSTSKISYAVIGPYTKTPITKKMLLGIVNRLSLSPALYAQIEQFYTNLRLISDVNTLFAIINTFGSVIWGNLDNFTWQDFSIDVPLSFPLISENTFSAESEDSYLNVKLLENIYHTEKEFLHAVSTGQIHKAELYMKDYTVTRIEQRITDPIRNIKNYSIILNTLLRKAVENGGVHPLHIDQLSASYAKKIELLTSPEAAIKLHKEMVHKYCLLVKNHSLKSYSPLIKKIVTNIDADLTADLTLNAQAKLLNVNASYLSSLFKKEMNMTLTEYVNRSRIAYAVTLLNSTTMQIQMIAQYCGIPDVNYFTKTFKKFIEKTPQEYRRHIAKPSGSV